MLWMTLLALVGCGDKDTENYDSILSLTGDEATGAEIYSSNCSGCHGASGEGVSGPSLIEHVPEHSDEAILGVVLNGEEEMPAFDLEDQEAADLLAYLRATFG